MTDDDLTAHGLRAAVACSCPHAARAAMDALQRGGSAVDAYITAALVQCVTENGSASLAGSFSLCHVSPRPTAVAHVSGLMGPVAGETYDLDWTTPQRASGRAIPVPGFLAGAHAAWQRWGRLPWSDLVRPALLLAEGGAVPDPLWWSAARRSLEAARSAEGREAWYPQGRALPPGAPLVQTALARTLEEIATDGPEGFYAGAFADAFVASARALGGAASHQDLEQWPRLARFEDACALVEGPHGHRYAAPGAELLIHARLLAEALDLRALGRPRSDGDTVYARARILEEVFCVTSAFATSSADFLDAERATTRARVLLDEPVRPLTVRHFTGTNAIAVTDADGTVVIGTHSINSPLLFGAGHVVGGVYLPFVTSVAHANGGTGGAPGVGTTLIAFPRTGGALAAASPSLSCMHATFSAVSNVLDHDLAPHEAVTEPRFGFPDPQVGGTVPVESDHEPGVMAVLDRRRLPYTTISMRNLTLGSATLARVHPAGGVDVAQDPRRGGSALAG